MKHIHFFTEGVDFKIVKPKEIKTWVKKVIDLEGFTTGEINVVFVGDEQLFQMNQNFLNHTTYTDIITFNYVEEKVISGELFISIDRVKENAINNKASFENELNRVIIHGILHLIGYNDKTNEEAKEIRAKEDFYLALQS